MKFIVKLMMEEYLDEAPIVAKGWTKDSIEKFGKTIGKAPGEKGFFKACEKRMSKHMGEKAKGFCAAVSDKHYGSPMWRGKGKTEKQVKIDTDKKIYKDTDASKKS